MMQTAPTLRQHTNSRAERRHREDGRRGAMFFFLGSFLFALILAAIA